MARYAVAHVLVALACGIWAYGDAKRRESWGILWLLIVFCMFPFGLVLWLLSRPKLEKVPSSGDPDEALKRMANSGQL
jgi:hypothetical protein